MAPGMNFIFSPSHEALNSLGCDGAEYTVEVELLLPPMSGPGYNAIFHKGHTNVERTVSLW